MNTTEPSVPESDPEPKNLFDRFTAGRRWPRTLSSGMSIQSKLLVMLLVTSVLSAAVVASSVTSRGEIRCGPRCSTA